MYITKDERRLKLYRNDILIAVAQNLEDLIITVKFLYGGNEIKVCDKIVQY